MAFNTIANYVGDGLANTWTVPFAYLKKSHVKLFVGGVEDTTFTWITDSSIAATSTPGDGVSVQIRRETPRDTLDTVIPNSGTFRGTDINNQSLQALYVAEEGYDALVSVLSLDDADGLWDAESKIIKNVATPTAAHHAARKDYVDAVAGSATAAAASADDAADSATAAGLSASAAAGSASAASGSAGAASASAAAALAAENNAEAAQAAAEAAQSAAASSASTATTQASNAASSASTATTQAGIATTQAGIATTQAGNAATSATAASNAQDYAEEWAIKVEDSAVSVAAGGDGSTTFSALHWAAKAAASAAVAATFDPGNYVLRTGGAFTGNVDFGSGIDVTGNITVTGTVDGVDIAARNADLATAESKLAGIEAGADVTDATNVAAAGAAMLSENETITGDWTFNGKALGATTNFISNVSIDGGGSVITNGERAWFYVPANCNLTAIRVLCHPADSITATIQRGTAIGSWTSLDSVVLSAATSGSKTGLSYAFTPTDIVRVDISGASAATIATVALTFEKT